MGVINSFKSYFARPAEKRAATTNEEDVLLRTALSGASSAVITTEQAMEIPAFSSAIDFISGTIAMLPIKLYRENRAEMTTEEVTDDIRVKLLNDESGDTLNPFEMKKAVIADMLTDGNGYIYIERKGNAAKSLRYVKSSSVSAQKGVDPIFKVVDILINGKKHNAWDFIIMARNTRDGVTGTGLVPEKSAEQISFFDDVKVDEKAEKRERVMDDIRKKFGHGSIKSGGAIANNIGIDE